MNASERIDHIRSLMRHQGDQDYDREIERHLDELQHDVEVIFGVVSREDLVPACASVTVQAA